MLPHPMGMNSLDEDPIAQIPPSPDTYTTDLLPAHQVVQVFAEAPASDLEEAGVVVSGMPGSVPFPGAFKGEVEIAQDELHIGGMTDVYVATSTNETATASPLKLSPEYLDVSALPPVSPDDNLPAEFVLLDSTDGAITGAVDRSAFDSPSLLSALSGLFGAQPTYAGDLAVQLIDKPDPSLEPEIFRIVHTTATGVRIDGEFPAAAAYVGLRFRLLSGATTSLVDPLVVLQQSDDLSTTVGALHVDLLGGVSFAADPASTEVYLAIDSIDPSEEYRITGKSTSRLYLETAVQGSGSSLSYRVYTRQVGGAAVQLPLVRVKSVKLADADSGAAGITVPYRHPVDVVSSDFAGYNDDPQTDEDLGQCDLVQSYGATSKAALTSKVGPKDFREYGVALYDVLRLEEFAAPNKHWVVVGFATDAFLNDTLLLDRDFVGSGTSSGLIDVNFTLGHPAVGTAEIVVKDPLLFVADSDTVFSYEDDTLGTLLLRPSVAESMDILAPNALGSSNVQFADYTVANGSNELVSAGVDVFKYGVRTSSRVQVVSRRLSSSAFTSSQKDALTLSGKTLRVQIDDTMYSVVFGGANPITLEDAAEDINQQLAGYLCARVEDSAGSYYLRLYSSHGVLIQNSGTTGILSELRLSDLDNQTLSGISFGEFDISSLGFVAGASTSIFLNGWTNTSGSEQVLFIRVFDEGVQGLYPSDFEQRFDGLYSASMTLTSYDPNVTGGLVPDESKLAADGYTSYGYDILVRNTNYSYSMGEVCSIRVTPAVLTRYATSLVDALPLPGALTTIEYEHAPTVGTVQDWLLNEYERVVVNNPLARHYLPAYAVMSVNFSGPLSSNQVAGYIDTYLATLYPNKPLDVFSLTSMLGRYGVKGMAFPQEAAFLAYGADRVLEVVRDKNVVALGKKFHIMGDTTGVAVNKV